MPVNRVIPNANHLLSSLPRRNQDKLLVNCESIELVYAEELYRHGELIPYVYFPIRSNISLVTSDDSDAGLEGGLVGDEGMLGISIIQGVDIAPYHAVVQGPGLTLRIPTPSFRVELERSYVLQRILQRYLYVSLCQLAQKVTCARFHVVEERLARWLLMTHDRAHLDSFHVTHVFLAKMLGVRRVGITKAANSLQKKRLISYHRGDITILDRIGLEAASCGCYRADKQIYEHILGEGYGKTDA